MIEIRTGMWTLTAGGAIAALAVAGSCVRRRRRPIKIGFINSYSGFLAQAGDEMEKGIDLYVKEHEKDLPPGVKVEIVKRDDAANPEVGKRVAQELITRDHVQLLVGVVGSPIAAAIAPLTAEAKVPLVITNAAGVGDPAHLALCRARLVHALAAGLSARQMGGEAGLEDRLHRGERLHPRPRRRGGLHQGLDRRRRQMVGSVRFPTDNPDFAPFVQRIKDAKPDVAFICVAGRQAGDRR